MNGAQRSILAAGGVLAAALVAGLAWGRLGRNAAPAVPVTSPAPTHLATSDPEPRENPVLAPVERRADDRRTRATWEVLAVDPRGRPLDAELEARGPDGARLEGRGRALWEAVEPGAWTLAVVHPDYPRHELRVTLAADVRERTIARLDTTLRLSGVVRDRMGAPRRGTRVWFLRPGENHPVDGDTARGTVGALTDTVGAFRVDLPEPGPWRVSVGPLGRIEAVSPAQEIGHGWPTGVDVVLAGSTRLEVALDRAPDAALGRTVVQVLEHHAATGPDAAAIPLDELRAERLREARAEREEEDERGGIPGSEAEAEAGAVRPMVPVPETLPAERSTSEDDQWLPRATLALTGTARAIFPELPAGLDLRLALVVGQERFLATPVFRVRPDETTHIDVTMPPPGAADVPLGVRVRIESLTADAPRAGFTWR